MFVVVALRLTRFPLHVQLFIYLPPKFISISASSSLTLSIAAPSKPAAAAPSSPTQRAPSPPPLTINMSAANNYPLNEGLIVSRWSEVRAEVG